MGMGKLSELKSLNGDDMDRILRLKEVSQKTGLPKSSIYAKIKKGTFPPQLKLGPRASGWRESELDLWIEQQSNFTCT